MNVGIARRPLIAVALTACAASRGAAPLTAPERAALGCYELPSAIGRFLNSRADPPAIRLDYSAARNASMGARRVLGPHGGGWGASTGWWQLRDGNSAEIVLHLPFTPLAITWILRQVGDSLIGHSHTVDQPESMSPQPDVFRPTSCAAA